MKKLYTVNLERPRLNAVFEAYKDKLLICVVAGMGFGKTTAVLSYLNTKSDTHTTYIDLSEDEFNLKSLEEIVSHTFEYSNAIVFDHAETAADFCLSNIESLILKSNDKTRFFIITEKTTSIDIVPLAARGLYAEISEAQLRLDESEIRAFLLYKGVTLPECSLPYVAMRTQGWFLAVNLLLTALEPQAGGVADLNVALNAMEAHIKELFHKEFFGCISKKALNTFIKMAVFSPLDEAFVKEICEDDGVMKEIEEMPFVTLHSNTRQYTLNPLLAAYLREQYSLVSGEEMCMAYKKAAQFSINRRDYMGAILNFKNANDWEALCDTIICSLRMLNDTDYAVLVNALSLTGNPIDMMSHINAQDDRIFFAIVHFILHPFSVFMLRRYSEARYECERIIAFFSAPDFLKLYPLEASLILRTDSILLASIFKGLGVGTGVFDFISIMQQQNNYDREICSLLEKADGLTDSRMGVQTIIYYRRQFGVDIEPTLKKSASLNQKLFTQPIKLGQYIENVHDIGLILGYHIHAYACCVGRKSPLDLDVYASAYRDTFLHCKKMIPQSDNGLCELVMCEISLFRLKYEEALEYAKIAAKKSCACKFSHIGALSFYYMIRIGFCMCNAALIKESIRLLADLCNDAEFMLGEFYYALSCEFIAERVPDTGWLPKLDRRIYPTKPGVPLGLHSLELVSNIRKAYKDKKYAAAVALLKSAHELEETDQYLFGYLERLAYMTLIYTKLNKHEMAYNAMNKCFSLMTKSGAYLSIVELGEAFVAFYNGINDSQKLKGMLKKIAVLAEGYARNTQMLSVQLTDEVRRGKGLYLTMRETDVMQKLYEGASRKEIAEKLFISVSTVKSVLSSVYTKLKVNNSREAIHAGIEHGIIKATEKINK